MNMYTHAPPWNLSSTRVNADGSFEFGEAAPPGEYVLKEWTNLRVDLPGGGVSMMLLNSKRAPLLVEAGGTTFVEVPIGLSVVGRIEVGNDQSITNVHLPIVSLRLKQDGPELKSPGLNPSQSEEETFNRWKEYREQALNNWLSEEGRDRRRAERVFEAAMEADGTFKIDNVTPGSYELQINAQRWGGKQGPQIRREISISVSPNGSPVDLGMLK